MAVSLNSVAGFNSIVKNHHASKSGIRASVVKVTHSTYSLGIFAVRSPTNSKHRDFSCTAADGDPVATGTSDTGSVNAEAKAESMSQTPKVSNGSFVTSESKEKASSADLKSTSKRLPLTVREKVRAARVLSRNTEFKAAKSEFGSNVLEALRESDKGKKRSGLPEAPTNLFDDSKRGMPKAGLTFELPVGFDVFIVIISFVLISALMFATTYVVWKVGAIHFNEY